MSCAGLVGREERRYDQNVQNDQNAQNTHTVFMRQMMESLMTATVESKTYLPEEEVARRFADIRLSIICRMNTV